MRRARAENAWKRSVNGGFIKGVLDLTTTEWCDEVVWGRACTLAPTARSAAALNGVPAVVSVRRRRHG